MKHLITCFFVLSALVCKADYSTTYLSVLIDKAEIIARIKIDTVLSEEIVVSIMEKIKGDEVNATLLVEKFRDWPCAQRWSTYEIGQEELVFLKKSDKGNGSWVIIGAGNEGEMPIENGKLYYKSWHYGSPYFRSERKHSLKSGYILGVVFEWKDVVVGIKAYLRNSEKYDAMLKDKSLIKHHSDNLFLTKIIDEVILLNQREFAEADLRRRFDKTKRE